MHADEVDVGVDLVRRLLTDQFPHWARLPIEPVPSTGTDNALFLLRDGRLGDDLVVRLPRIHWAVGQVEKEQRWLPRLAPCLPLAIPEPVGMGGPSEGYPWRWSVYRWLPGENATRAHFADLSQTAADLAGFVLALRRLDVMDEAWSGAPRSTRGVPLAERDAATRIAIDQLGSLIDARAVLAAWEAALAAPAWDGPPIWSHGDIQPGNLLVRDGRLSAVIDFGCLGVGDPACDLMIAWTLFRGESRDRFRAALAVDAATWARGRGWALSVALIALPYYLSTNPAIVELSRRAIAEVLASA